MLRLWLRNLKGVTVPEVEHLVYLVDGLPPGWWETEAPANVIPISSIAWKKNEHSIGYFHNLGAKESTSEWIMKMDVDVFPSVRYFKELLGVLSTAQPKEWFNGGMIYLDRRWPVGMMSLPLTEGVYQHIMDNRRTYSDKPYLYPAATNFICRRQDYLDLGGCSEQFKGYGWEDYQQIYMLERHQQGKDPLPGLITMTNVTQRCRDGISRPKARGLWERNPWLCLLHNWHPQGPRTPGGMNRNRQVLFNYIMDRRADNKA